MRSHRRAGLLVLLAMAAWSESSAIELHPDGWHKWRVEALGRVSEACCYTVNSREMAAGCDLDARGITHVTDNGCAVGPGFVEVYVLMQNGDAQKIRVLSSECTVSGASEIRDLGNRPVDETLLWLSDMGTGAGNRKARKQAIFALSQIPGKASVQKLVAIVEAPGLEHKTREEALFWLAMSESDDAFAYFDQLLTEN